MPSEVPRSAGAADAREAEKASAVTARRGYLDWSVRIVVSFSLGVELGFFLLPFLAAGDLVQPVGISVANC